MAFDISMFLLPFLALGVHIAQSQLSLATCQGDDYTWLFNSKGQSPCDMAAYLMAICQGSNFTVDPLHANWTYVGPGNGYEESCSCGTVTWSLFAACAACQNGASISWSRWSSNCSSVYVSSFPYDIPPETAIPDWAYLGVGGDDMWNASAAKLDLGEPESTATSPSSSTPSGHLKTTNGSHHMVGPIIGGVVGGVIVLVILMVGIMIARRRYVASRRPPSTLHGPQGTSPYRVPHSPTSPGDGTEHSMGQKLYDPSDPITYPSPSSYEPSTTTYPSVLDSPVYGQQPYQTHGAPLSPNRYANQQ